MASVGDGAAPRDIDRNVIEGGPGGGEPCGGCDDLVVLMDPSTCPGKLRVSRLDYQRQHNVNSVEAFRDSTPGGVFLSTDILEEPRVKNPQVGHASG